MSIPYFESQGIPLCARKIAEQKPIVITAFTRDISFRYHSSEDFLTEKEIVNFFLEVIEQSRTSFNNPPPKDITVTGYNQESEIVWEQVFSIPYQIGTWEGKAIASS